jgi:hypothetical protein
VSHTFILTEVRQIEVNLTDEEYDMYSNLFDLFEDYSCGDMEAVERTIEEV